MRSIYRAKKITRRSDGTPVCVLAPLPPDLNDRDRERAATLREHIKTQIRRWLLGGHILIFVYEDGHSEPAPFQWEVRSDSEDPLLRECWDDPINALVMEVFLDLHGDEYRSARDPNDTSPDEDINAWVDWALERNGFVVR